MTVSAAVAVGAGAPRVGVTVTGLALTPSVVSVQSSWDGGTTWHPVREAKEVTAVSALFVDDFVPALNVELVYRVVVHSGAAVTGGDRATVTVVSDVAWIQDPLDPRGAVPIYADLDDGHVLLASKSLGSALYAQETDVVVPAGSAYPVASIGRRLVASNVPLKLTHELLEHAGALARMLMSSGTLVIRGLVDAPLDPVAHVVVGDVTDTRTYSDDGTVSEWDLTVRQVRPTSMRIVVPWWSYADVKALWDAEVPSYAWAGTAHASRSTLSRGGTVQRTNLVPNPSFETSTLGCSVSAGTSGVATTSRPTSGGRFGSAFLRASWTTASTAAGYIVATGSGYRATVTPLETYQVSVWVRPSTSLSLRIQPVTSTAMTGGTTTPLAGTFTTCPAGVWTELTASVTPATGRGFLEVRILSAGAVPVGTVDVDGVLVEQAAAPGTYFDGSSIGAVTYASVLALRPGETYLDWLADSTPEGV